MQSLCNKMPVGRVGVKTAANRRRNGNILQKKPKTFQTSNGAALIAATLYLMRAIKKEIPAHWVVLCASGSQTSHTLVEGLPCKY